MSYECIDVSPTHSQSMVGMARSTCPPLLSSAAGFSGIYTCVDVRMCMYIYIYIYTHIYCVCVVLLVYVLIC